MTRCRRGHGIKHHPAYARQLPPDFLLAGRLIMCRPYRKTGRTETVSLLGNLSSDQVISRGTFGAEDSEVDRKPSVPPRSGSASHLISRHHLFDLPSPSMGFKLGHL